MVNKKKYLAKRSLGQIPSWLKALCRLSFCSDSLEADIPDWGHTMLWTFQVLWGTSEMELPTLSLVHEQAPSPMDDLILSPWTLGTITGINSSKAFHSEILQGRSEHRLAAMFNLPTRKPEKWILKGSEFWKYGPEAWVLFILMEGWLGREESALN